MDNRSFESGAAASPPSAPASPSAGYPTNGNPGTATPATIPGEYWFHQIGEELRQVIVDAGLTPDDADLTQLSDAIQALIANAAGTYPAFSVHRNNSNQTAIATATFTKVQFTHELFDTNNNFDSSTNYRFTPTVAGKYLVTFQLRFNNSTDQSEGWCAIYKNGALLLVNIAVESGATATQSPNLAAVIDMNGTTDYLEFYCYQNTGGNRDLVGVPSQTFATGMRIK